MRLCSGPLKYADEVGRRCLTIKKDSCRAKPQHHDAAANRRASVLQSEELCSRRLRLIVKPLARRSPESWLVMEEGVN